MNIHSPYVLILLLVLPLLFYLMTRGGNYYKRRFKSWAEERFLDVYLGQRSPFYWGLKVFLLIVALGALVLAMARPQWDYRERELESVGLDIVFAIDISRSMDARDISPDRLTRAKLQVSAFIDQLKGDRIGLISFAGEASIECPLTDDYEAARIALNSLSTNHAIREGTDIGRALNLARRAFDAGGGDGILILISDGEDLENSAIARARELAATGVRIYTMGVGSEQGAIVVNPHTGSERVSKLDSHTLERIAKVSGGEFYRITPGATEIQLLLSRIYQTEQSRSTRRNMNLFKEQYHIFTVFALLLLMLESIVLPLKRHRK